MNLKDLRNLGKDDILDMLGLETKASTAGWFAGTAGTFVAGLLVGAGVGLMIAPKSGRGMREDLRERLRRAPDDLKEAVESVRHREPVDVGPSANRY